MQVFRQDSRPLAIRLKLVVSRVRVGSRQKCPRVRSHCSAFRGLDSHTPSREARRGVNFEDLIARRDVLHSLSRRAVMDPGQRADTGRQLAEVAVISVRRRSGSRTFAHSNTQRSRIFGIRRGRSATSPGVWAPGSCPEIRPAKRLPRWRYSSSLDLEAFTSGTYALARLYEHTSFLNTKTTIECILTCIDADDFEECLRRNC